MLLYLRQALDKRLAAGATPDAKMVMDAINEGAVLRVRPKASLRFKVETKNWR